MSLIEYARNELERAGLFDEHDFYGGMTGKAVMELVECFANQNHSGMSASLVRSLFNRVVKYMPIEPLTFEDDEWKKISEVEEVYQNKRCPSVFKDGKDGKPYYLDAFYMVENDVAFTGKLRLKDRTLEACYLKSGRIGDPIRIDVMTNGDHYSLLFPEQLKKLEEKYILEWTKR